MKTRLSKKLISVLLAALMVLTSAPLSVFAVSKDDAAAVQLKDAITAYETKMTGNAVYTNMSAAYSAYLTANQAYDAYVYGNDGSVNVAAYANALTNATNAMQTVTADNYAVAASPSSTPYFAGDDTTWGNGGYQYYSNVLWGGSDAERGSYNHDGKSVTGTIYYPQVTFLYDGIDAHTPMTGIMLKMNGDSSNSSNANRYFYGASNAADGMTIDRNWTSGNGGTVDFTWNMRSSSSVGSYDAFAFSTGSSATQIRKKGTIRATASTVYFATTMKFIGSFSANEYVKTITPAVTYYCGSDGNFTNSDITNTITGNADIYVVNYRAIYDALIANQSKLAVSANTYLQGGAAAVFSAFDAALSFNPNTYFTSSNDYNGCANAIKAIVDGINNATSTQDTAGYEAIRSAIDNSRSTYEGDSSKYTADSWAEFEKAYEATQATMKNLLSTGYNNPANADAQGKALDEAKANLVTNEKKADTAELERIIDDATVAIQRKEFFTADSYAAADLEDNVPAAKVAVWGNEANYKNDGEKVSEDQQPLVEEWEDSLQAAILLLVIDTTAIVPSADYEGTAYSMATAVEYANSLNPANYKNYRAVQDAVSMAGLFVTQITSKEIGAVASKIDEYVTLVEAIISAIADLQPSFSALENGTFAHVGTSDTFTTDQVSAGTGNWYVYQSLTFTKNTDVILFRTNHDAAKLFLGTAYFGYNAYTKEGKGYDQMLDSINMADEGRDNVGTIRDFANKGYSLNTDELSNYPGNLSITNNGGVFGLENVKVTRSTSNNGIGRNLNDQNFTDYNFDFTEYISVSQGGGSGDDPHTGGILANEGLTNFQADYTLSIPQSAIRTPAAGTVPTMTKYEPSGYFGFLAYGKRNAAFNNPSGYLHSHGYYDERVTIIDIASLIDLINLCGNVNPLDYTTPSYDEFIKALGKAKADMDYPSMSANEILDECVKRYNELWTAKQGLEAPMSNQPIKDAVDATMATYLAGNRNNSQYSQATWDAFVAAYEEAYNSIDNGNGGKYSDLNIRELDNNDENVADIQRIADTLMAAYEALAAIADFTPIYEAIEALTSTLADDTYTVASLQAMADALAAMKYLNMTDEEKSSVYADAQDEINAEAAQIAALTATVAVVDSSAIDAAIVEAKAKFDDPDAWTGVDAVLEIIQNMTIYDNVVVYGSTVRGIKYANQDALDADVRSILSGIQPQEYNVSVDGQYYGTYKYGEEAVVNFDKNCAIYYAYTSNTATNSAKYYTTDSTIRFIVKGNTQLTTKSAEGDATVKVTYVNGLKNKTYDTDYVTVGDRVTLADAPSIAYYDFVDYTVNGESHKSGDSVTVSEATSIVANYELIQEDVFTVYVHMNKSGTENDIGVAEAEAYYNNKVELTEANLANYEKVTNSTYNGAKIIVEGEEIVSTGGKSSVIYKGDADPIYAYAIVDFDVYDDFEEMYEEYIEADRFTDDVTYSEMAADFAGALKVVNYGTDYSFFVSGDTAIYALSEKEYNHAVAAGLIETDVNGAVSSVKETLIDADTKWSMIGTYAIPTGATLIENGILFAKEQSADLKMSNVDGKNVYRFKSSQHTIGNQFVISFKKPAPGTPVKYAAYTIYELNGVQFTVISNAVNAVTE